MCKNNVNVSISTNLWKFNAFWQIIITVTLSHAITFSQHEQNVPTTFKI